MASYTQQKWQEWRNARWYLKGGNILFTCRDLKRDVAKKLEKLEKRTQKAIVELIREYQNTIL